MLNVVGYYVTMKKRAESEQNNDGLIYVVLSLRTKNEVAAPTEI